MAGEKNKRIKYESWKYPEKIDQARDLISNMLKMGSPVVDRGGVMSCLKYDELGIRTQPMSKDNLLAEMENTTTYQVQKWEKALAHDGKEIKNSYGDTVRRLGTAVGDIPMRVINTAYGLLDNGLWKLRGVLTHPIINRDGGYVIRNGLYWRDGDVNGVTMPKARIHLADGYDARCMYFFAIPDRVAAELAGIENQVPTLNDMVAALDYIDLFLCDFIFATPSAKASAVAFMLTMVCRQVIEGSVPMLEVRAPEPQSGKSLLVKMMIWAITGEHPRMFTPTFRDVAEFEKELFSHLLEGRNYIFMDNVYGKVQSSFLDMAVTTGYSTKRLLGMNVEGTVYSGMPFVMTANNPQLSDDIKNRIYLLDLLKPLAGAEFKHGLPEAYAREAGPKLLRALFTLYNHWDKNEKRQPFKERRIDGFIEWSQVIGGILQAAAIDGFLDDTMKQIKEIDPKLEQAADMARPWYEQHQSNWIFVKDTFNYALEAGYVKEGDSVQEKIQKIAARLARLRMTRLPGGYHFERNDDESRGSQWRVVRDA